MQPPQSRRLAEFRFIDLFAGIGGFRLPLEQLGGRCVASSEIAARATRIYKANWPSDQDEHNLGDLSSVDRLPKHDLLVGGVPCQAWSIAGKNRAFDDPRGALWKDVLRVIETSRPRPSAFIFENVKGLVDPRNQAAFEFLVASFEKLGYDVSARLLNAFDHGLAQSRPRVFMVGTRRRRGDQSVSKFEWPAPKENRRLLYQIFDDLPKPDQKPPTRRLPRDPQTGERTNTSFDTITVRGERNPFLMLNDLRDGPTAVHSWEIYRTTARDRLICETMMRNRRKPRYGSCDGNPMGFKDVAELVSGLVESELQRLVEKRILVADFKGSGRYEFRNRRLSGGIDGVYRVYLPTSRYWPTLTATGMRDRVATVNLNLTEVSSDDASGYRREFIRQVLRPGHHRTISAREAARLQGFPDSFLLPENEATAKSLLGNAVPTELVRRIAEKLIATGVLNNRSDHS